jgi:hypothetical protein
MKVFIGMETSGALRRVFQKRGHDVISCDTLPAEDGSANHIRGDVFDTLDKLKRKRVPWVPDLAIFHPTCTYLTISAEWAYGDGPYHQKVKPGTLVGEVRRLAREKALIDFRRLLDLGVEKIAIENPIGAASTRIRKPDQIVQPWWFGDDASKATCLWLKGLPLLKATKFVEPRMVNGWPRWANQTDSGQNRLSPSPDRWKERSRTYPGLAAAIGDQWG